MPGYKKQEACLTLRREGHIINKKGGDKVLFNIFKKERKYQVFLGSKLHEVPQETIEEKNKEKNGIFDEYYEWEPTYCGDDFPNFDDYLEYKNLIEDLEKERGSENGGETDS